MGRYLSPRYGQVILVNEYLFVELSNNGFLLIYQIVHKLLTALTFFMFTGI